MDYSWIKAIIKMGAIVEEKDFENRAFIGCKEQRENPKKLFDRCSFYLSPQLFDDVDENIIHQLIRESGGIIHKSKSRSKYVLGVEEGTIRIEWFYDCITDNEILSTDLYILK